MINYVVVGQDREIVTAVLRAIRSFTDGKSIVVGDEQTSSLRWSSLCERHFTLGFDRDSDDYFVELIAHYAERTPHATLIAADCAAVRLINRVRQRLALNIAACPDVASTETFASTALFQSFCRQHRLPVLQTIALTGTANGGFASLASSLGLPFLIRRVRADGQVAAMLIHEPHEFERATRPQRGEACSAQRYVDGTDVALCLLADRGQLSTLAIQTRDGSQTHFIANDSLQAVAHSICRLTAYHGALRLNARIERESGQVFLTDAAPQFWPDLSASLWCGLNFVAENVRPTPRRGGVRQLCTGKFAGHHPLIRPAAWRSLLADPGGQGRLLRSMTFDAYSLLGYARKLPMAMWRYAAHFSVAQLRMRRTLATSLHGDDSSDKSSVYLPSHRA